MVKVLIVDDDEIVRRSISKVIDWEGNGFHIVAEAANGLEGFEAAKEYRPNIVISDIRMPFMDGLEMAEKISRLFPLVKVIFLTGYDEGIYARKAIDLKANAYILKYSSYEEILSAAIKTREEIDKEKSIRLQLDKSRKLSINKFCSDLVTGVGSEALMESEAHQLGMSFPGKRFCIAVSEIYRDRAETAADASEEELIVGAILNVVEETLQNYGNGIVFSTTRSTLNILLNIPEEEHAGYELLNEILEEIVTNVNKYMSKNIIIGVGRVYRQYTDVCKSYKEAHIALQSGGMSAGKGIVYIDSLNGNEHTHQELIRKIVRLIENDYYKEDLSLEVISRQVFVSPAYISTLFKKYMSINLNEYINRIRIEEAKKLLCNTALKTYEISERIGYSNAQYFSFAFKKYTGCSPMEFKKMETDKST